MGVRAWSERAVSAGNCTEDRLRQDPSGPVREDIYEFDADDREEYRTTTLSGSLRAA